LSFVVARQSLVSLMSIGSPPYHHRSRTYRLPR
jgi:hypothetical protein